MKVNEKKIQMSNKKKLKFEDYKNCLQTFQLENKINYLEKKTDMKCFKESHKDFTENNKTILKPQQIFKSKRHNVFTGAINKIALTSNDDEK